jgi:transposase
MRPVSDLSPIHGDAGVPLLPVRSARSMVTQEYTYAYAAVYSDGILDSLILPHMNSDCMQIFLDEVALPHRNERIIMVFDGAGWHTSGLCTVPQNMRLVSLPAYAPELNPVEHIWDDLREKAFHNQVFESIDGLEDHLEVLLQKLEEDKERVCFIVAWPLIIKALII